MKGKKKITPKAKKISLSNKMSQSNKNLEHPQNFVSTIMKVLLKQSVGLRIIAYFHPRFSRPRKNLLRHITRSQP